MTPAQMIERINKENIYSDEFEEQIPTTLRILVDVQNAIKSRGGDPENTLIETYLTIFKHLGRAIIVVDGEMQPGEAYGLTHFTRNLEKYVGERVSGYALLEGHEYNNKNGISGGVEAPGKKRKQNGKLCDI